MKKNIYELTKNKEEFFRYAEKIKEK